MAKPYLYKVYGLTIASCVNCPHLPMGQGQPDVLIRDGEVPDKLPHATERNLYSQVAPGEVILFIPNVAKFWVQKGELITIQRYTETPDDRVCIYLFGSAMGALLHQRGRLVLHGSAIAFNHSAVLFLGRSGAGKSTLAAAFQQQGYPVVTDDICAIEVSPQGLQLYPSSPQIKLRVDACEKLGHDFQQYPELGADQDLKYGVGSKYNFWKQPLPLKKIYVLAPYKQNDFRLQAIVGSEIFAVLSRQTYRLMLLQAMGYASQHLKQCIQVANQVPISRIARPDQGFLVQELVKFIQDNIMNE